MGCFFAARFIEPISDGFTDAGAWPVSVSIMRSMRLGRDHEVDGVYGAPDQNLISYHGMGQAKPLTHRHENAMTGT